ncbi:hypothetical protein M3J09_011627 [Ascochyta lentis]
MRRSPDYSILGYENQTLLPISKSGSRQNTTLSKPWHGLAPAVRSRRGPNDLALVKKLSLTVRGGGGDSEMKSPQCQHQGG